MWEVVGAVDEIIWIQRRLERGLEKSQQPRAGPRSEVEEFGRNGKRGRRRSTVGVPPEFREEWFQEGGNNGGHS